MEQPDNIDQLFRNRLAGAEVPPPAFVWPNVEAALRQRRRRLFFWLWFGLGLTGAGSWALWATTHTSLHSPVTSSSPIEKARVTGTGGVATREEDYARTANAQGIYPAEADKKPITPNQAGSTRSNKQKSIAGSAPTIDKRLPQSAPVLPTGATLGLETRPVISPAAADNSLAAASAMRPLPPANYVLSSGKKLPGVVLPKAKPVIFKKKVTNKNCYNFGPHTAVWLIDAYGGPSLPKRQLTASQPAFEDYLQQRRKTEQADWAFNAGVRASLLFGQHFLVRSGLHYEHKTEVFEYADPDYVQVTIRQTTKIIDNVVVIDIDTIGIDYGEHYVKTYNRYGQLDIPLLAGLEFRAGRLGLSLQAGASINVYFWKRGTLLNTADQPESFSPKVEGSAKVFRNQAGWSTQASAQLFYHLRSRVRIFAEPYGSHNLRPLTLAGQPISQRYTTWGLKLGLTKILD